MAYGSHTMNFNTPSNKGGMPGPFSDQFLNMNGPPPMMRQQSVTYMP